MFTTTYDLNLGFYEQERSESKIVGDPFDSSFVQDDGNPLMIGTQS